MRRGAPVLRVWAKDLLQEQSPHALGQRRREAEPAEEWENSEAGRIHPNRSARRNKSCEICMHKIEQKQKDRRERAN